MFNKHWVDKTKLLVHKVVLKDKSVLLDYSKVVDDHQA